MSEISSAVRATFMPRPPPPAAALISTGKPMSLATFSACGEAGDCAVGARHHRNAELLGRLLGLDLVAHDADVLGRRADEGDRVLLEDLGEAGVLGQEAIARMHGVGAGDLAGRKKARNVEIAVARGRGADAHAFIGEAHVHGVGVRGASARQRWRCRAPCRRAGCAARSHPGWRSGLCRTFFVSRQ